jgi:hypothetical protein
LAQGTRPSSRMVPRPRPSQALAPPPSSSSSLMKYSQHQHSSPIARTMC